MSISRDELTAVRRRLPDLALASTAGGEHRLRAAGRRSPVLVLVHAGPCAACDAFVRRLGDAVEALRAGDAEVTVIAPAGAPPILSPFPLLLDAEGRVASVLGVRAPAVVIADQWGEVHEAVGAGEEHRFPRVGEIESWVQYLAIQCPECQGEAL
jgi:peroxiredoxin